MIMAIELNIFPFNAFPFISLFYPCLIVSDLARAPGMQA
jgi:hypothetical protein